ncbi:MAG: histidinol-phosphatase [Planctomycetales bacterium]
MNEITARLDLARQIAHEAGQLTLKYFRKSDLVVEQKNDNTPVTIADREAEQLLRSRIESEFSDDGIIGEEFDERPGSSPFRWMLDPIDGTKSFVAGVPLFGTLVGITKGDEAVIGVIEIAALGESVHAAKGHGAWYCSTGRPPVRARVSDVSDLSEALFCTTQVDTFDSTDRRTIYEQLQQGTRLTRTWGDCYGYILVATGRAELMVDPQLGIWDTVALQPVIEEAGGIFTDFLGNATVFSGEAIASNGQIHQSVLDIASPRGGRIS